MLNIEDFICNFRNSQSHIENGNKCVRNLFGTDYHYYFAKILQDKLILADKFVLHFLKSILSTNMPNKPGILRADIQMGPNWLTRQKFQMMF